MEKEFSKTFYMSAGECDPRRRMPVPLLVSRIIEVATLHANSWGVGYRHLIENGCGWVLSRLTLEMEEWPAVDTDYRLTTWIENYNRHYSQRCMEIADAATGRTLGYARTIWMVLDMRARTSVDISQLEYISANVTDRPCPIAPQSRLRPITAPTRETMHLVSYTDCDFYRHMNTVRYVELLMNQFDLSFHDKHDVHRLELAFTSETRYGTNLHVKLDESEANDVKAQLDDAEGTTHLRARVVFNEI